MQASRKLVVMLLASMAASSASANRCEAADAAAIDPAVLTTLSIEADDIKYQARCEWWFASDTGRTNSCLYVQTADSIYFLDRFASRKTYGVKMQRRFEEIESVALQHFGRNRQIQLRLRGDQQLLLFYMAGTLLVDVRKTEAIYVALVASGVHVGEPVAWISPPTEIVVPVYVGH